MLLYKLTDSNGYTRNNMLWGKGVTHSAHGTPRLCSNTVIHAYTSPLLAVLLNPLHARFISPRLWIADGDVVITAWDKVGCHILTTTEEIPLPTITLVQKTAFAILCALEINKSAEFKVWAENWLSGKDRTAVAAYAAAADADADTYATYAAAAAAAAAAADADTYAAYAADTAAAYAVLNFQLMAEKAMTYK